MRAWVYGLWGSLISKVRTFFFFLNLSLLEHIEGEKLQQGAWNEIGRWLIRKSLLWDSSCSAFMFRMVKKLIKFLNFLIPSSSSSSSCEGSYNVSWSLLLVLHHRSRFISSNAMLTLLPCRRTQFKEDEELLYLFPSLAIPSKLWLSGG